MTWAVTSCRSRRLAKSGLPSARAAIRSQRSSSRSSSPRTSRRVASRSSLSIGTRRPPGIAAKRSEVRPSISSLRAVAITHSGRGGACAAIAPRSAAASPRLHWMSSSQSSTGRAAAARAIASSATRSGSPGSGAAARGGRRSCSTSRAKAASEVRARRSRVRCRSSQKSRRGTDLRRRLPSGIEEVLHQPAQPLVARPLRRPGGLHCAGQPELDSALEGVARQPALAHAGEPLEEHDLGAPLDRRGAYRAPHREPLPRAPQTPADCGDRRGRTRPRAARSPPR